MEIKTRQALSALKWSIATAAFLTLLKLLTGFFTHSMAVLASALDSAMDVAASVVNLLAAREAAKPPDENHAYGHGKIESLASLFQSAFIGVSGLFIFYEAVKRLIQGASLSVIPLGIGVMFFSMFLTWLLTLKLKAAAKQSGSLILATEKLHFTMDLLTNGGAIAALLLVKATGIVFFDLLVSILISLYILKTSLKIFPSAVDELLDRSLPPVSKEEIEEIIRNHHPSIVDLHNFRSRRVRDKIFLDFHIEIRGEDDFKKAHLMTESLISRIEERYPGADVTVHFDPEGEA